MFAHRFFSACAVLVSVSGCLIGQPQSPPADPGLSRSVVFSTDQPIDVPGYVLQRGTYVLRIKDEQSGRTANTNLIELEVLDGRQTYVVAEFPAMQIYDASSADNTILTYYEGTTGRRALKTWFHLSTNYSERLVYSNEQAAQVLKDTGEQVLTMASLAAAQAQAATETARATPPVDAKAEPPQPSAAADDRGAPGESARTGEETPAPAVVAKSKLPVTADESHGVADEFPKTAGELPIVVWLGLTTLAAFIVFRMYWRDPAEVRNARNSARARRVAAAAYRNYKLAQSPLGGKHL